MLLFQFICIIAFFKFAAADKNNKTEVEMFVFLKRLTGTFAFVKSDLGTK